VIGLIPFEAFSAHFPDTHRRTVERMALRGDFPPFVRMTPGGPAMWNQVAVDRWLLDKLAPLMGDDD
jgi:hypothetical protein